MDKEKVYAKNMQQTLRRHSTEDRYIGSLDILIGYNIHKAIVERIKQKNLGKKVLLCTGNRAMRNHGFLDIYLKELKGSGFVVEHYDNISSNPTLKQMIEGFGVAKRFRPDLIFALGGGSVIDTSKVLACELEGDVWDFVEKRKEIKRVIPIIACSTTSGTGSHVSPYAVITNTDTLEKKTLKDSSLLPRISAVDIDILQYMPDLVIASTGFDVLSHAVEVFTRKDCTPVAAYFCRTALKYIREHLIASYNGDSMIDKVGMAYADIYAGIALTMIGTHVPHAISHPISGRFPEINHGTSLAYVLAETSRKMIEKGYPELNSRFAEMSALLGGSSDFVRTIRNYQKLLDLNTLNRFSKNDCEKIYLDTMGYRRSSVERMPVVLSENDIREIIYNSMGKKI